MRKGVYVTSSGELEIVYPAGQDIPASQVMTGRKVVDVSDGYPDDLRWDAPTRTFVSQVAAVKQQLIAAVKVEAERRKMLVRSPGSGKGAEYRQKRTEALASATILAATLNALTAADALKQYPAAAVEAKLTGEKLAVVLARYLTASTAADAEINRLAAIEWNAKVKIDAATSVTAARAAAVAVNWTWKPA